MTNSNSNIVIVGSGVSGALIARELLARNVGPVLMLEAGPSIVMAEQRRWLDYVTTGKLPYDVCLDHPESPATDSTTRKWLRGSRLFARGGSTLHWGGWAPRLRPEDFALRSATGHGADWPFGYAELEPYYCKSEQSLGVAGDSSDTSLQRSLPYPFGPFPFTEIDGEVARGCDALGYDYAAMPIARNLEARDGFPACQTIGTCRYCPLGARYTASQTLDRMERQDNFELRSNAPVKSLLVDNAERVAGVIYKDLETGLEHRVEAELVILCAGSVETAKLMLNSRSEAWPNGVGNASDHLGRHLCYHPLLYARGHRLSNPGKLQHELDFPTFCSRHFDNEEEQAKGKLFMFLPPVRPRLDIAESLKSGRDRSSLDAAVSGPFTLELQAFVELFPDPGARVAPTSSSGAFGLPGTRVRFSSVSEHHDSIRRGLGRMSEILKAAGYRNVETGVYNARGDHAAAICRMSASDSDGVVDSDLRVHGTENLYVCSNAVFPSLGAVNPTLTLTALAMRLADYLVVRSESLRPSSS